MFKASTENKREHKPDFGHEKIKILYEDPYLAVIVKPCGMLSVPYPGSRARTALDVLEQMMRKAGTYSEKHRPFIVHRLDRDTSGIMMFAMTESAQKKIMDTWHSMVTERLYRAVAENPAGQKLPDSGLIDDPIAFNAHNVGFVPHEGDMPSETPREHRNAAPSVHEKHIAMINGQTYFKTVSARTHYRVILRGTIHTMFELSLDTGRKNQIRAHLAGKGYPIAGDENYRAQTDPFSRLALHARTLEFKHPFTGKHMKFEEPEPSEWLEYIQKGDPKDKTPSWIREREAPTTENRNFSKHTVQHRTKNISHNNKTTQTTQYSAKKKLRRMDYIARGKAKSK